MTEIPESFSDSPHSQYDDRVQSLVVEVMRVRSGVAPEPEETVRYLRTQSGDNIRGKHLVITPTAVYSVKTTLHVSSNMFTRCDINIELPRSRADLVYEVVTNKRRQQFLMLRLGNMKLPGILAEKDDLFDPGELGALIVDYVSSGHTRRVAMSDELPVLEDDEKHPASMYIMIRRFEARLRKFVLARFQETYPDDWAAQLARLLGDDLEKIRTRIENTVRRYGWNYPEEMDPEELMEHLGFEHYEKLFGSNKIWRSCFEEHFTSREEAIAGLKRIADARNEVAHGRPSAHPLLWQACQLEMDSLQGQMMLERRKMADIIQLVQQGSKALTRPRA